jgi:hypothetical protein
MPSRLSRASVQTHSEDSIGDGGAMLTSKSYHTGEGRCPWQNWVPAFAGKTKRGIALNDPNAPKYQILNVDLVTGWLGASAVDRAVRKGSER